jgi:hypothetical protein
MSNTNASLLEKLKAGKRNTRIITWPGRTEKIMFQILTEQEVEEAQFEVERRFKSEGIEFSASTVDAYQAAQNTAFLARAIVDTETGKRMFKSTDELAQLPGFAAVKSIFIEEFNALDKECNPSLKTITEGEYQKLFTEVKKTPSTLNFLNSTTLIGLVGYLASQPVTSPTDRGSTS